MYSGNIGHFQNLEVAIRAAARIRHLPRFRLQIIGSGMAEDDLRLSADDLGANNVRFLGRRPFTQMGAITNLADALLVSLKDLPFFAATIPGKTQVALAAGRPVVMAVRGDAADMIRAAGAGEIVEPGDEIGLAAAFDRLYRAPAETLSAMGGSGRRYYEDQLSLARGARRASRSC